MAHPNDNGQILSDIDEIRAYEHEQGAESRDAEVSGLEAQIVDLKELKAQVDAELAQVKADLAECQGGGGPDPEPTKTLFGTSPNGAVGNDPAFDDLQAQCDVVRVFGQGLTTPFKDMGVVKKFLAENPDIRFAVSCTNNVTADRLGSWLDAIPDNLAEAIDYFCYVHEPENPDKGLNAAAHKAKQAKMHKEVVRPRGFATASCLMGYTLVAKDRDWREWIDVSAQDALMWDKYNSGNKKNPPVYQDPVQMVDEAVKVATETGKPWGFWETGTNNFGSQSARVSWAKALREEIIKHDGVHAIWFDRTSTSGSGWDATLDRPTAEAWLGL